MNYNDIKNLNISKRGKKELLNALNKGGGSGAGVTIVDSVDKLDKNAPVGTPAIVAVGGGSRYQTFSEVCAMVPPFNLGPDTSQEETIEILKKLPIITDIKFNIPNQISQDVLGALVFISSEFIESGSMNDAHLLMILVQPQGVMCAMESVGGDAQPILIIGFNEETQKYELDKSALQEFDILFKSKTWVFAGKDVLSSLTGELTPETIAVMDEVFSLLAGAVAQAELYIKKEEWQKVLIEDIEAVYAKLNTKQNIISRKSLSYKKELEPNTYYTYFINNTNALQCKLLGHSISSVYEEYIIELEVGDNAPSTIIFVNDDGNIIDIKWANSMSPTFNSNTTYLISISGNFAVFAQFTNE